MRKVDELIAVYPGQDALARRFLLDQFEEVTAPSDSEEVLQILAQEVFDPESELRQAALFHLSRILPGVIRYRYNIPGYDPSAEQPEAEGSLKERRNWGIRSCRALGRALLSFVDSGSPKNRTLALLSLSRLPLTELIADLRGRDAQVGCRFELLLACALASQSKGNTEWLIAEIEKYAAQNPDLWLLLSFIDPPVAYECIRRNTLRTNALGRINLTVSLGNLSGVAHLPALTALMGRNEIWVALHGLRAVEKTKDPELLPLVTRVFSGTGNELLRVRALAAAGAIPGDASLLLCRRATEEGTERVRTQALESLIRLGCHRSEVCDRARPLLGSSLLRTRVIAIIATTDPHDETPPAINELMMSASIIDRMEGAYCLGQIQNKNHLALLMTLALVDPSPGVRAHALKHLGLYGATLALPGLMSAIGHTDPATALAASRVLSSYDAAEAHRICQAVSVAIRATAKPFKTALLYRVLGALVNRCEFDLDSRIFVGGWSSPNATIAKGALVGLSYMRRGLSPEALAVLDTIRSGSSKDRYRALFYLFLQGDLQSIPQIVEFLSAMPDEVPDGMLDLILEWALLVHEPGLYFDSPGLVAALEKDLTLKQTVNVGVPALCAPYTAEPLEESWLNSKPMPQDSEQMLSQSLRMKIDPILPEAIGLGAPTQSMQMLLPSVASQLGSQTSAMRRDRVNQLRDHLRTVPKKDEGAPEFLAALRLLGGLDRIPVGATLRGLAPYRYVIVSTTLFLIVMIVVLFAPDTHGTPVESKPSHDLSLRMYRGQVTLKDPKATPSLGMPLKPDAVIRTSAYSSASIITRTGGRIEVGANSRIVVKEIAPGGRSVSVEISPGIHVFDFRGAGAVRVQCLSAALIGSDVWFNIDSDEGSSTVMVSSGKLALSGVAGGDQSLDAGDARPLQ